MYGSSSKSSLKNEKADPSNVPSHNTTQESQLKMSTQQSSHGPNKKLAFGDIDVHVGESLSQVEVTVDEFHVGDHLVFDKKIFQKFRDEVAKELQFKKHVEYSGQMVKGVKDGKGGYLYPNGDFFYGKWANNQRNGFGICFYKEQKRIYKGNFVNDNIQGEGIMSFADGVIILGNFSAGGNLNDGFVQIAYKNGDRYAGSYKNNKQTKSGTYYFANGDVYKGEFEAGVKEGHGEIKYENGTVVVGIFKKNQFISGKYFDTNRNEFSNLNYDHKEFLKLELKPRTHKIYIGGMEFDTKHSNSEDKFGATDNS